MKWNMISCNWMQTERSSKTITHKIPYESLTTLDDLIDLNRIILHYLIKCVASWFTINKKKRKCFIVIEWNDAYSFCMLRQKYACTFVDQIIITAINIVWTWYVTWQADTSNFQFLCVPFFQIVFSKCRVYRVIFACTMDGCMHSTWIPFTRIVLNK